MEESSEMHSEDDKALSDKNKKRTLKTRSQIEALEKFYDEHKYPTESMKLQLAERIGLTEKQISSWFCHRRLKDKRVLQGEIHGNGRQDRSSGVIQDLGSGLRQDSCGSTKQGDDKYHDPIEVQSRRFTGQDVSAVDLTYERGSHYTGSHRSIDETSSGSSSSPRNVHFKGDPVDIATSKFMTQNLVNNVKGGNTRTGPSGYLKVKGRIENPAITAVKRQLGRQYREDGPPLGVQFDPLPPGAFQSSIREAIHDVTKSEPCYGGEHVLGHSPAVPKTHQEYLSDPYHAEEYNPPRSENISRIRKRPIPGSGYGYTSSTSLHNADLDCKKSKIMHGSDTSETLALEKPEQRYYLSKLGLKDVHEGSSREREIYNTRDNYEMRATNSVGGFRTGTAGHHHIQLNGREVNEERGEPWSNNSNDRRTKVAQGDRFHSSSSDLAIKGRENDGSKDQGFSRKVAKVGHFYGAARKINNDRDPVQPKNFQKTEMRGFKDKYPPHEYARKASWIEVPYQTNQFTRSGAEMPSGLSEDEEHAETSTSED